MHTPALLTAADFKKLKESMPYKWKVQACGEYGTTLVAFVDARDIEDRFDEVCGPEKWKNGFQMVGSQMMCAISLKCGDEWVSKSDGGTISDIEGEKGLISDSFKRAAVKWGPGRFLYRLDPLKLNSIDTGKEKKGKKVYAPAHNTDKHGPVEDVPNGLLKWDWTNKCSKLEIKNVNDYIWKFLQPKYGKKEENNNT